MATELSDTIRLKNRTNPNGPYIWTGTSEVVANYVAGSDTLSVFTKRDHETLSPKFVALKFELVNSAGRSIVSVTGDDTNTMKINIEENYQNVTITVTGTAVVVAYPAPQTFYWTWK